MLSGYPHLEEAYRVGELLFPHLDLAAPDGGETNLRVLRPQSEVIANDFYTVKASQS